MKEVQVKRFASTFKQIPFQNEGYIQSPIGLVPKDDGRNTRLIFHLSYPRDGHTSINSNTPKSLCSVRYLDFSRAIQICRQEGVSCSCGKSDWKSAFRHFPIKWRFWNFLLLKAKNPIDQQWYYFVDKCMPFGSSISCAHFQAFSDAISFVMWKRTGKENVNYLDDFLFIALTRWFCNHQIDIFLQICRDIKFPVAMDKNLLGDNCDCVLGYVD